MQFFTGLEAHGLSGRDANFSPSAGIASDPGLAGANTENTKAAQLNALSRSKGFFQAFKDGIDRRFGLGSGQACALDHMVHDVLFNQSGHLSSATILDCTTPYRTDGTAFGSFVEHQRRGFLHRVTRKAGTTHSLHVFRLTVWSGFGRIDRWKNRPL
jgi:hypothetical protein